MLAALVVFVGRKARDTAWPVVLDGALGSRAAADVVYALLELKGLYVVGTPLDIGWAVGLAFIAWWIDASARPDSKRAVSAWSIPAQAVPVLATATALGVLILASGRQIPPLAVTLASLTLILATVPLVFRQRIRLADLHSQAMTDELTGLPNRRALYTEVPIRLAAEQRRRRSPGTGRCAPVETTPRGGSAGPPGWG